MMLDKSRTAQKTFEMSLPKPYWLTRERINGKWNGIKAHMGQGQAAAVAREDSDEGAMLAAVKAKL
jgi:hypothetical protein